MYNVFSCFRRPVYIYTYIYSMKVERMAFVQRDKGLNDIFTANINVSVEIRNGLLVLNINNGVALIILDRGSFDGGRKRYKKSKGRKSKKRRRSRKKGRRKTGRRKQIGGKAFTKMILSLLFSYFMFSYLVTIQFVHNKQNRFGSLDEWRQQDPMQDKLVQRIFENKDQIRVTMNNKTSLTDRKIYHQIMSLDGTFKDPIPLDSSIFQDYNAAFAEVNYGAQSDTQKLAALAQNLPYRTRPVIQIGAVALGYTAFAQWQVNSDDGSLIINLFNITNSAGEHPDSRLRNTPDSPAFNDVIKGALTEQIQSMFQIGMLQSREDHGWAEIGAVQLPQFPSISNKRSQIWHKDAMPWIKSDDEEAWMENYDDIRMGGVPPTSVGRTSIHDAIFTITYGQGEFETPIRHTAFDDGEPRVQDISTTEGKMFTKILDQHKNVQHATIVGSMGDMMTTMNRNLIGILVMPGTDAPLRMDPDVVFTPKDNMRVIEE